MDFAVTILWHTHIPRNILSIIWFFNDHFMTGFLINHDLHYKNPPSMQYISF